MFVRTPSMVACLSLFLLSSLCLFFLKVSGETYDYMTYDEMLKFFIDVQASCNPGVDIEVFDGAERFDIANFDNEDLMCGSSRCKFLVVSLTGSPLNTSSAVPQYVSPSSRPEVYISGALHGNERIGPNVVAQLTKEICNKVGLPGFEDLSTLLQQRRLIMSPMTNPEGYYHKHRHEKYQSRDPNRDFPYQQNPSACMLTLTGRVVNELFRRHLFRLAITFHGGTTVLSYAWGSFNHMTGKKSTESPDNSAIVEIAKTLQDAAGVDRKGQKWYPVGPMTDTVYAVRGGMEDWAYGAGFEAQPSPINSCSPSTYGGYPEERTRYGEEHRNIRTVMYLVEMSDLHTPPSSSLGHDGELWKQKDATSLSSEAGDGHISRNLRLALKLLEMAEPGLMWGSAPVVEEGYLNVEFYFFGCEFAGKYTVFLVDSRTGVESKKIKVLEGGESICRGLPLWKAPSFRENLIISHKVDLTTLNLQDSDRRSLEQSRYSHRALGASNNTFFVKVEVSEFDAHWSDQSHPDPPLPPQTHLVKSRREDSYQIEAEESSIRALKKKEFYSETTVKVELGSVGGLDEPQVAAVTSVLPGLESATRIPGIEGTSLPDTTSDAKVINLEWLGARDRLPLFMSINPKNASLEVFSFPDLKQQNLLSRGRYVLSFYEFGDFAAHGSKLEVFGNSVSENAGEFDISRSSQRSQDLRYFVDFSSVQPENRASFFKNLTGKGVSLDFFPLKSIKKTGLKTLQKDAKPLARAWAVVPLLDSSLQAGSRTPGNLETFPKIKPELLCALPGGAGRLYFGDKVQGKICPSNEASLRESAGVSIRSPCCAQQISVKMLFFNFFEGKNSCQDCGPGQELEFSFETPGSPQLSISCNLAYFDENSRKELESVSCGKLQEDYNFSGSLKQAREDIAWAALLFLGFFGFCLLLLAPRFFRRCCRRWRRPFSRVLPGRGQKRHFELMPVIRENIDFELEESDLDVEGGEDSEGEEGGEERDLEMRFPRPTKIGPAE